MNHHRLTIWRILSRKAAVILLIAVSAVASFATLGDGKTKTTTKSSLLSNKTALKPGSFSLRSGYTYRGNKVINNTTDKKYINLNTVVTVQKGKTTFTIPLKKKVVFDKIKIDLGNRQLKRN
ncbi:MAG: hypothetical protein HOP10_05785 [Chitinophagaceae bacterium]|nr:hypothetical protein [Chitinophagaceae bacterium]